MPDNYGETVLALDTLREKKIKQQRSESIPDPLTGYENVNRKAVSPPEAQLARLQKAAQKADKELQVLHEAFKERLKSGEKVSDEVLTAEATKALTLRKRLEYFDQVGNEIFSGQKPEKNLLGEWFNTEPGGFSAGPLIGDRPYAAFKGDVPAAVELRKK